MDGRVCCAKRISSIAVLVVGVAYVGTACAVNSGTEPRPEWPATRVQLPGAVAVRDLWFAGTETVATEIAVRGYQADLSAAKLSIVHRVGVQLLEVPLHAVGQAPARALVAFDAETGRHMWTVTALQAGYRNDDVDVLLVRDGIATTRPMHEARGASAARLGLLLKVSSAPSVQAGVVAAVQDESDCGYAIAPSGDTEAISVSPAFGETLMMPRGTDFLRPNTACRQASINTALDWLVDADDVTNAVLDLLDEQDAVLGTAPGDMSAGVETSPIAAEPESAEVAHERLMLTTELVVTAFAWWGMNVLAHGAYFAHNDACEGQEDDPDCLIAYVADIAGWYDAADEVDKDQYEDTCSALGFVLILHGLVNDRNRYRELYGKLPRQERRDRRLPHPSAYSPSSSCPPTADLQFPASGTGSGVGDTPGEAQKEAVEAARLAFNMGAEEAVSSRPPEERLVPQGTCVYMGIMVSDYWIERFLCGSGPDAVDIAVGSDGGI